MRMRLPTPALTVLFFTFVSGQALESNSHFNPPMTRASMEQRPAGIVSVGRTFVFDRPVSHSARPHVSVSGPASHGIQLELAYPDCRLKGGSLCGDAGILCSVGLLKR